MSERKLIGRSASETLPELKSTPGRRRLPDDLLWQASRRLEIVSLLQDRHTGGLTA